MAVEGLVGEAWVLVRPYTASFGPTLKKEVSAQVAAADASLASGGGLVGTRTIAATEKSAATAGEKAGLAFSSKFSKVGRETTHGLGGALIGAVGLVEIAKGSLEATKAQGVAVAQLQANTDEGVQQAQALGDAFLKAAKQGKEVFTAPQLTAAFAAVGGQLKLATGHVLTNAQALEFMSSAEHDAEATGGDLNAITGALASTMAAYHIPLHAVASESDALFNVSRALNMPIDAVSSAVNRLHARLGEAAPSLTDTGALMVAFGKSGIQGQRGLMMVTSAINSLLAGATKAGPASKASATAILSARIAEQTATDAVIKARVKYGKTSEQYALAVEKQTLAQSKLTAAEAAHAPKLTKAQKAVSALGLEVFNAQGKFVGMRSVIEQLGPRLEKMTQQQRMAALQTLFGKSSAAAMLNVIKQGTPGWDKATAAVDRHGTAQKAAAEKSQTLEGRTKTLGSEMNALETTLGNKLTPELEAVVGWLGKNQGAVEALAGVITGVMLLAVGRYVGGLVKGTVESVAALTRQAQAWVGLTGTVETSAATQTASETELGAIYGVTAEEIETSNAAVAASAEGTSTTVSGANARMAASSGASMGMMKGAILGVAAAIGSFELGKATRGHGGGGAAVATLGGAVMGAVAGFAIGGPFGAAIGAAGGALIGLAGHFDTVKRSVDDTRISVKILTADLEQALKLDKSHAPGKNTRAFLENFLTQNPAAAHELAVNKVSATDVLRYLRGGTYAVSPDNPLARSSSKTINVLQDLMTQYLRAKGQLADVNTVMGQTSGAGRRAAAGLDAAAGSARKFAGEVGVYGSTIAAYGAEVAGKLAASQTAKHGRLDVQFRAGGGDTAAGGTYVVGERGPELLQMGSGNGRVVPHGGVFGAGVGTGDLSAAYLAQIRALLTELIGVERAQPGALARHLAQPAGHSLALASPATRSMHE